MQGGRSMQGLAGRFEDLDVHLEGSEENLQDFWKRSAMT